MNPMPPGVPPSISASIVAFKNEPDQLCLAIHSVLKSSVNVALTVIDNSPSDQLRSLVEDVGAEYSFSGNNLGFGKGHNVALKKYLTSSDFHLVLNPDVRFGDDV